MSLEEDALNAVQAMVGAGFNPATVAKWIVQYGPAIEATVQLIELHEDEKKRAAGMDSITRGLQYAKETKDTSLLDAAILAHCGPDGCRV